MGFVIRRERAPGPMAPVARAVKPAARGAPSQTRMEAPPTADGLAPPAAVEESLVGRARAGDGDAFRALVEMYQDRVFGLAVRLLGSREEAEEAAQDAFVRAWRALPRFRGESRFSTWLFRIALRRIYDAAAALRARRRREAIGGPGGADAAADAMGATGDGASGGSTPDGARVPSRPPDGIGELERRRLERLVAALPEAQREAITLYYYEDRSVEEVARTLGVPEGTVKTHLFRARAALRRAWGRTEDERGMKE